VAVVQQPVAAVKHPVAAVKHSVAVVQHPVAAVKHPVAAVKHSVAVVQHLVAVVQHPAAAVKHPVSAVLTIIKSTSPSSVAQSFNNLSSVEVTSTIFLQTTIVLTGNIVGSSIGNVEPRLFCDFNLAKFLVCAVGQFRIRSIIQEHQPLVKR
jgi:hypothetical protein